MEECSKKSWKKMEEVQTTTPMASIHKGEECLQQAVDLQKKQTISKKINESKNDMKQLFHLVNNITMSKEPNSMPEGKMDAQLAGEFASFFLNKNEKIRLQFQNTDQYIPEVNASVPRLHELQPLTNEEIEKKYTAWTIKPVS